MATISQKMNESPEITCAVNVKRSLFIVALMWSLLIVLFVLLDSFRESHNMQFYALGFIWLLGLFFFGISAGKVSRCIDDVRQVTEEFFRMENERLRHKAWCEEIFNSMSDAVIFLDNDNCIAMVNPAFSKLTGYSFEEVRGLTPEFLFTGQRTLRKLLRKRYDKKGNLSQPVFKINFKLKDGFDIPTETIGTYVHGPDGEVVGFLTVMRDISQRRRDELEKEILGVKLKQSYKMEAIGTLAGGIAHDFNNILGIILINTDMALEDIIEGNPAGINVERIVQAARRARDLVKQILAYSRQTEHTLIPLMPGALIKESLELLRSSTPATVSIVKSIDDDYRTIMMDPVQVQQMLMNLFSNAMRAMQDRGTIEVKGETVELDETDIAHQKSLRPGPYFKLSVSDTGAGMEQAVRQRIFDPFFIAGETEDCTVTGLSNVMGIVKNHGGMITVVSAPEMGTTFDIFFPIVEPEYGMEESGEVLPGNERILLVDDEDMLIEMTSMYLQRHGYQVVAKKGSLDALEAFQLQPDAFDIVVTDQTMPDMTGSELAVELLKIRPDIPVILFSGFSKKISRSEVDKLGIREFLYKPFDGKTLIQAIRRVMDEV